MRAVVQRVSEAKVIADGAETGRIGRGYVLLLGVEIDDTEADTDYLTEKVIGLRVFNDDTGKFNRSLLEVEGAVLLVSQFTLLGDARKGRRPSFTQAARPELAVPLYERMIVNLRGRGVTVATGVFGAHMDVHLVNDGPVTILLDSKKVF